jgi:hypothetical protein
VIDGIDECVAGQVEVADQRVLPEPLKNKRRRVGGSCTSET